jgi:hypothetical protein
MNLYGQIEPEVNEKAVLAPLMPEICHNQFLNLSMSEKNGWMECVQPRHLCPKHGIYHPQTRTLALATCQ